MPSLDTHKLNFLLLSLFFASASKEGCALIDGVEGFGPFGNPWDRFHTMAIRVFGDRAMTSASGFVHVQNIIH